MLHRRNCVACGTVSRSCKAPGVGIARIHFGRVLRDVTITQPLRTVHASFPAHGSAWIRRRKAPGDAFLPWKWWTCLWQVLFCLRRLHDTCLESAYRRLGPAPVDAVPGRVDLCLSDHVTVQCLPNLAAVPNLLGSLPTGNGHPFGLDDLVHIVPRAVLGDACCPRAATSAPGAAGQRRHRFTRVTRHWPRRAGAYWNGTESPHGASGLNGLGHGAAHARLGARIR